MKRLLNRSSLLIVSLVALSSLSISGVAGALSTTVVAAQNTEAQRTQTIINKGNQEIDRRLASLAKLNAKITSATKLTSSDKTTLTNEVTNEINGLTTLKTKLDADTTLADAKTDAQSIYTEYRVYALIVPKVGLIRTADDQQVVETKLTTLAAKLQTRITSAKTSGKDVTTLQAKLDDLTTQVTAAQAISSSIETKVIGLQPTDYNSDHTILSGDAAQLKTAHADNQAAIADAKVMVNGLKNL